MSTELRLLPPIEQEQSLTITAADRLAAKVGELLDAIAEMIPNLQAPHPSTAGHARGARTVSREFIVASIAAAEEHPDLRRMGFFDPDEARAVLQFIDAFRPISNRLQILAASLNHTMAVRKAKVATGAMNTYMMAKRYARNPARAELTGHVENLRRCLGRKNRMSSSPRKS